MQTSSSQPVLSVLIPTLESRNWQSLVNHLEEQASKFNGYVEVLTELDNGGLPSGVKRQRLTNRAKGAYLAFVDDDDWVSDTYVADILGGIGKSRADVITFNLELKRSDRRKYLEHWSYRLVKADDRDRGIMCANHLCAWRAELARLIGWCPVLGYGDDQLWYKPLIASRRAETEYHINRPLYEYRYCPRSTAQQQVFRMCFSRGYVNSQGGLRCFWWNSPDGLQLVVEARSFMPPVDYLVTVYDCKGVVRDIPTEELAERTRVTVR